MQWRNKERPYGALMAHADFVMCDSHEWAVLLMCLRDDQLLVASEDVAYVPETGEGRQKRARDMAKWGEVAAPDNRGEHECQRQYQNLNRDELKAPFWRLLCHVLPDGVDGQVLRHCNPGDGAGGLVKLAHLEEKQ